MERSQGILPQAVLGLFMILVAGAIALSLVTAPPVAPTQLHEAAQNTLAASSFIFNDANAVASVPSAGHPSKVSNQNVVHVVYQAPDRVLEIQTMGSQSRSLLAVQSVGFQRTGSSKWVPLPPTPGGTLGETAAGAVLLPLKQVADAYDVVRTGSTYRFTPGDADSLLGTFGLPSTVAESPSTTYSATISGENVSSFRIFTLLEGQRVTLELRYVSVGSAPAVNVPPASDIAGAASSSVG